MTSRVGPGPRVPSLAWFPANRLAVGDHNSTLDYLRFGAACLIVLFHAGVTPEGTDEAAVGLFTIALVYLTLQSLDRKQPDPRQYIRRRTRRLIYPMLIWGGLHLAAKGASVGFDPAAFRGELATWLPPHGTMAQLWFLPWALVLSLAAVCVTRLDLPRPRSGLPEALRFAFLGAVSATVPLMVWSWVDLPTFYGIFVLYGCSAVIGLFVFVVRDQPLHMWLMVLGLMGLGSFLRASGLGGTEQMIVAAPLFALAMALRLPNAWLARQAGIVAFSLYLVHVLVIAIVINVLGVASNTLPGALLVLAISLAVALGLRLTRSDRWLT